MSDQEFREKMIDGMARLEEQMKLLVGEDGLTGRVRKLEDSRNYDRGIVAGIAILISVSWAILKQAVFGR